MTTNIPDGYGQVSIEYQSAEGTEPFVCTFGIVLPGTEPLQEVVDAVFDVWTSVWAALTFDELTMVRAVLTVEAPGGGLGSVVSSQPAVPGDASGNPAALAMAVLVNKRTGLLGRAGRGRFFIPGMLGTADVDASGLMTNSTVELYQEAADTWLEAMNTPAVGWTEAANPQVLHSDASLVPSAINGLVVSNKVGILRKRIR